MLERLFYILVYEIVVLLISYILFYFQKGVCSSNWSLYSIAHVLQILSDIIHSLLSDDIVSERHLMAYLCLHEAYVKSTYFHAISKW